MGEFSRRIKAAGWEARLAEQQNQLRQHIPLSEEEAVQKALAILDRLRAVSGGLGYRLRSTQQARGVSQLLDDPTPGVPGREVLIRLPALEGPRKQADLFGALGALASPVTVPARAALEDWRTGASKNLGEHWESATRTTTDPSTLPWFYPLAALTVPVSFMRGYRQADKELDEKSNKDIDIKLEEARKSFERALREEYDDSLRRKAASAGELIDGLAKHHVKSAEGELNQAAGLYLALAALTGGATHMAAKDWWEKRDPQQQRLSALRDAIKRRIQRMPPPVLVAPEAPGIEETAPELSAA
jgi:hypothetical protein